MAAGSELLAESVRGKRKEIEEAVKAAKGRGV